MIPVKVGPSNLGGDTHGDVDVVYASHDGDRQSERTIGPNIQRWIVVGFVGERGGAKDAAAAAAHFPPPTTTDPPIVGQVIVATNGVASSGAVADATAGYGLVRLIKDQEVVAQTTTDHVGHFAFDRRVPDGAYELTLDSAVLDGEAAVRVVDGRALPTRLVARRRATRR